MKITKICLVVLTLVATATVPGWAQHQAAKPMTGQGLEELLSRMTVREKIGQLNFCRISEPGVEKLVRAGEVGGFLNVREHELREKYEKIAVNETRLGIPLLHCLLYTSPSPRDGLLSRMPSSA